MRYLIVGKFENGFRHSEYSIPKFLGTRIIELQDSGMEVISVSQVEEYGENEKSYSWVGNGDNNFPTRFEDTIKGWFDDKKLWWNNSEWILYNLS